MSYIKSLLVCVAVPELWGGGRAVQLRQESWPSVIVL